MKIENSEFDIQCNVFAWALKNEEKHPELWLLNGSQNGIFSTAQHKKLALRSGLKRGYPDIFLPVSRGNYHGLYIELKFENAKLSEYQKEWNKRLRDEGYLTATFNHSNNAIFFIENYLKLKEEVS